VALVAWTRKEPATSCGEASGGDFDFWIDSKSSLRVLSFSTHAFAAEGLRNGAWLYIRSYTCVLSLFLFICHQLEYF
jgi:hypothetical protein